MALGEKSTDWHMTDLNNACRAGWGKGHLLEASYSLLSHRRTLQRFWSQSLSSNAGIVWGHTVWVQEKWTPGVFLYPLLSPVCNCRLSILWRGKARVHRSSEGKLSIGSRKSSRMDLKIESYNPSWSPLSTCVHCTHSDQGWENWKTQSCKSLWEELANAQRPQHGAQRVGCNEKIHLKLCRTWKHVKQIMQPIHSLPIYSFNPASHSSTDSSAQHHLSTCHPANK